MKTLLIYDGLTPVVRDKHANYAIKPNGNFGFARQTNSVPAVVQEFGPLTMHYPIVFGQAADGIVPAVVLGVRDNENLYVAADGTWDNTTYVPAFVRRYPFVFGSEKDSDTLTLLVDESCAAFNSEGEGEKLFDANGEQTAFLKNLVSFLGEYQAQSLATAEFTKTIAELGLLEPAEVHLPIPADPERRLRGFLMVNRDKLRDLPAAKLRELNKSGALELIHLHLFSLMNMGRLQERMAAQPPAAA